MKTLILLLLVPLFYYSQQYTLPLKFENFRRWSFETKEQKLFYHSGKLKRVGNFRLYTVDDKKELLAVPVNRHVAYRRNGRIKWIMNYTQEGLHKNDSLYKRSGALKRVYVYVQ